MNMERILIIEDNPTIREGMAEALKKANFHVEVAAQGQEGLRLFEQSDMDCVVTDLKMDDMDGIEVLRRIRSRAPQVPVLIITAFGTIERAVEAMQLGAYDFITKPFSPELLRVKIRRALERASVAKDRERLYLENQYLRSQTQQSNRPLLGESPAIEAIRNQISKVAKTPSSVFISGESGCGKELVARAIHELSPRAEQPFIKVNCAALAEGVLESELFGHEKGAFTGAVRRKPGRFELAHQGTLFLDEIGDISPNLQLKLLRVLQEREFERVGGTSTIKVDVRIISATNQDLRERVAAGRFRDDLYYRLVIVPLHIPPLRERREDIPLLANEFLRGLEDKHRRGVKSISAAALEALMGYEWPGNVRELENLIEQSYVFCETDQLDVGNLPKFLTNLPQAPTLRKDLGMFSLPEILDRTERELLEQALARAGGIKTRVAKLLGIKVSALYYKLEKYGLLELADKESRR